MKCLILLVNFCRLVLDSHVLLEKWIKCTVWTSFFEINRHRSSVLFHDEGQWNTFDNESRVSLPNPKLIFCGSYEKRTLLRTKWNIWLALYNCYMSTSSNDSFRYFMYCTRKVVPPNRYRRGKLKHWLNSHRYIYAEYTYTTFIRSVYSRLKMCAIRTCACTRVNSLFR